MKTLRHRTQNTVQYGIWTNDFKKARSDENCRMSTSLSLCRLRHLSRLTTASALEIFFNQQ